MPKTKLKPMYYGSLRRVIEVHNHLAGRSSKRKNRVIQIPFELCRTSDEVSIDFTCYNEKNNQICGPGFTERHLMTVEQMRELANAMLTICDKADASLRAHGIRDLEKHRKYWGIGPKYWAERMKEHNLNNP